MDESAAAVIGEDGAEKNCSHNNDRPCENNHPPSTEDSGDVVGVFCCQDCGAAFSEEAAFLEHRHLHPQQNMYLNKQSDAKKDNEAPYFCTFCSHSFVDINELRFHMKNHNQTSPKESDFVNNSGLTKQHTCVCPDCGKSYAVIGHFLNHLRSHRSPSASVFNDLEHLKKKSFQCESCGRNYSRASALDAHRRCHEENLVKSKSRSSGDTEETRGETKPNDKTKNASEKQFECLCGKAFSAESRLKAHQRFSRNSQCTPEEVKEKPNKSSSEFYCTECNKAFSNQRALTSHQRWHHNPTKTSTESFLCKECGKVFKTLKFHNRHQRMAHSDETPAKSFLHQVCQVQKKAFECKDCGLKFSRASALQSHQLQHTVFNNTEEGALTQERELGALTQERVVPALTQERELGALTQERVVAALTQEKELGALTQETEVATLTQERELGALTQETEVATLTQEKELRTLTQESEVATLTQEKELGALAQESEVATLTQERELGVLTQEREVATLTQEREVGVLTQEREVATLTQERELGALTQETEVATLTQEKELGALTQERELGALTKFLLHQDKIHEGCWEKSEPSCASPEGKAQPEKFPATCKVDELHAIETDEDMESYEPGDFNVQVVSDSESEDEASLEDPNPDLELLCESDQDIRDNADSELSPGSLVSKSNFKIVQVDFDQTNGQCTLMESGAKNQTAELRFDCPDCYRWFTTPSSLRVHRMWHEVRKRRHQHQGQSMACETSNYEAQFNHIQSHHAQTSSSGLLNQAEGLVNKSFTCNECGDIFSCLSALVSHQLHHPTRKQFQCPDCMSSYLHASSLFNHMKTCSAQKREAISGSKKEYNPKKTLLGPKIYHCEQCGKGFWSLGAFSHHKQNQMECTDLRLRKGLLGTLHSVNGRSRSVIKLACPICGKKFRHKRIMALHMRRHENGNHKCKICNRSFRLFSSLLRHEVVHSDQLLPPPIKSFEYQVEQLQKNTYSCPDCGKLFSRAKALQFHMKSHGYESGNSPSSPQSMVKVKNLQCATCLAHFNNKASLRAHRKICIKSEGEIVKTEPSSNDAVNMCSDSNTQEYSKQVKEHRDIKNGDIGAQQTEMHRDGSNVENPGSTHLKYNSDTCDRNVSLMGALNVHNRTQVEDMSLLKSDNYQPLFEMPHKKEPGLIHCLDCGRRFMTKSALGSHKRWHKEKKCSQASHEKDDFKSVGLKREGEPFQYEKGEKKFFNNHVFQVFNPQCETKAEPNLNMTAETNNTPDQVLARENECCNILKVAELQGEPLNGIPEHTDANTTGSETLLLAVKPKTHQCSLCFLYFANERGLHVHERQTHSKRKKCKNKLSAKTMRSQSNSKVDKTVDVGMVKSGTVGRGRKKVGLDPLSVKLISCLDCGERCSTAASLLGHKKVCLAKKQESKVDIEIPEATAEVPPALSHLSEHTVKCLFKCDKCGNTFQTEEQLGTHKNKAKSRPHCCALCCHGFWTENQLQQHLAWHDEVRCRLPSEVRFRLSAAVNSNSLKSDFPDADNSSPLHINNHRPLNPTGWSQSEQKLQCHGKVVLSQNNLEKQESLQFDNLYRCLVCSKTFIHVKDLIDHAQECTSGHTGQ